MHNSFLHPSSQPAKELQERWTIFTISIMHLLDLPTESVPQHHIVVKLVPPRRGREFGAGELGEWGEVEAVDEAVEGVERCEDGSGGEESCIHC